MAQPGDLATSAADAGVDPDRLRELFDFVRAEVDEGRLPAAQVAVARRGRLAGAASFGRAVQGGVERPVDGETLFCIYSSTKAVVAAAVLCLVEDGLLSVDERAADVVPAFAGQDKDAITIEQVMLHVGGFPGAPMHPRLWEDRALRLERMAGWRLNWPPGSRFEYHATSAHWLLAEVISARTGRDFRDYVRERLLDSLGLSDLWVGLPDAQHRRAADVVYMQDPSGPDGPQGEVNPETILHFNLPSQRRSGCPGGGGFATAAAMALFYQALLGGGLGANGGRALRPQTIALGTHVRSDPQRHRDPLTGMPVNRGLLGVVAGDDGAAALRGFGGGVSARAFGHGGAGGQIAWGDPAGGLSLGFVTNGFAGDAEIARRTRRIGALAAACARPAGGDG